MNTLEVINKRWEPKLERAGVLTLVVGLVGSFGLAALGLVKLSHGAMASLAASFVLQVAAYRSLYHLVKCPNCGHPLAKFKNGKNMPIKQVYNSFGRGAGCSCCGWSPAVKPV